MKLREIISKRIHREADGVTVAGDVNAVVAANVNEKSPSTNAVSSRTRTRIVQRGGKTEVAETKVDGGEGGSA